MNTPCAASFEKISKVQNWQIECQHAGFTPEKTPPSLTNTTLAAGKVARTRTPLSRFRHAHHRDRYRKHDFNGTS